MGSIRLVYDAEGNILGVDFRLTGEKPRQGIELHDNITILHLTLLSYSALLEQPFLLLRSCKIINWSSCRLLEEARLNRIVPVREDTMRSHAETGDVFF